MTTIDKINSMDVYIEFIEDGAFSITLNNKEAEDGYKISVDQLRIIARSLSRIAVEMWQNIDNALLGEKREEK